jgi:hypothetical protein
MSSSLLRELAVHPLVMRGYTADVLVRVLPGDSDFGKDVGLEVMDPLELVHLARLIACTQGRSEIRIGLIDGPVALNEPDLASEHIHLLSSTGGPWKRCL